MAELLQTFEADLKSVAVIPSDGGRFEISVDGALIYSKLQTGRHLEPGEGVGLVHAHLNRKP